MGERFSINSLLTPENEQANACHEFALLQYYKALKRLRERMSDNLEGSANPAIILCFLFTIFEFLQGNDTASLIHLRSGLNILRRHHGSLSAGFHAVSPNHDPLTHEILRIFSVMDMQATIWLGLKTFQAPTMIPLDDPGDGPAHSDLFSNLDEASESLNHHIVSTYHFRRLVAAYDNAEYPDMVPPEVYAKKEQLIAQLKRWLVSLEAVSEQLRGGVESEMSSKRIAVLQMNYETILMTLTACLKPAPNPVHADHELGFRHIVALAKSVIPPTNNAAKLRVEHIVAANNSITPVPMFSFCAGVIQPLYLAAIECPNLDVRREAMALLSYSPWREGAWDSATMARIAARRVQEVEERCILR